MTDTLKSICEQCSHLRNPRLDCIPEESQRQKEIILRDLKELVSTSTLEQEKSVILLAGNRFESILYCFIQSHEAQIDARRGSFRFNPYQSLDNYRNTFNRWFSEVFAIPDTVVRYRNMVHINRELEYPPDICARAAREMLRLLDAFLGQLSSFGP